VKSLAKKNVTKATAKKTLLGSPRRHPRQLRKSPTPPDVDIPMFTDVDEEPVLAESANSGGDGDSDSHVLSTVRRSNRIASKVAQVCQNRWRSGHQVLIQEDTSSDEADTAGESLNDESSDEADTASQSPNDEETDDEGTDRWGITSAIPGEEGMSLWDLLGQGFLREASELGM
jgi:hypothetical protein